MARKTKEDAEKTRLQLLDAARRLFLKHGVSKTTLEQIAKEAGYSRGAIHWHFKNKVEIFVAMKELVSEPLIVRLDEILLEHPELDQMDAIGESIREFLTTLEQDEVTRETFTIMKRRCEYTDEFETLHHEIENSERDCRNKLGCAFARARQLGLLRADIEPEVASEITQSFIVGSMNRWLDDQANEHLKKSQLLAVDAFIYLLRNQSKGF
jgi:TetR/AcrR family acrAB operon transcriptional repressor